MGMGSETERLLDRVRKLLALATSPNVHEAALAAARAQELIERHRLEGLLAPPSAAEVVEDARESPLEVGRRIRKWKRVLAQQLAAVNGCMAYTLSVGREERLVLVGTAADRAATTALWEWLCRRIEWLSATHGAAVEAREGRALDKPWHDAFRIGAVETIVARLQAVRAEALQAAALESTALAVVERRLSSRAAQVEQFAQERLRLTPGRGVRVDAAAYARGRAAGDAVPLPDRGKDGG